MRQLSAHRKVSALRLRPDLGSDGCLRWRVRQLFVADDARDLFDQIFFNLQIKPVGRRGHGHGALAFANGQTQPAQCACALGLGQRHTNDLDSPCNAQRHGLSLWHVDGQIVQHRGLSTADIQHQLRDAFNVFNRRGRIYATLKPVTGIG